MLLTGNNTFTPNLRVHAKSHKNTIYIYFLINIQKRFDSFTNELEIAKAGYLLS